MSGPVTRFRYSTVLGVPGPPGPPSTTPGPAGPAGTGTTDGMGSITLTNGLNSNISAAGTVVAQRIVGPSAAFSVGGFALSPGSTAGQRLTLVNTTAQAMTIVHEDASSTAANRIDTQTGVPVVLEPRKGSAGFLYDVVSSRWVLQNTGYSLARGCDVRNFGAKLDGSTDDTAAVHAADLAALALNCGVYVPGPGKCLIASTITILSDIDFASKAMFTGGTVILSGRVRAHSTQQIFDAGVTAQLTPKASHEIWCEWWGADPSAIASVNTVAITAALAEFQRLMLLKPGTYAGSAPILRLGVGTFVVTSNVVNAPIFNLKNIQGGLFQGCGSGQTAISCTGATWGLLSPASVFRFTNCAYAEIRDMDILNGSSGAASGITADVAVGSTTITIDSTAGMPGSSGVPLGTPIPVTLYKFGNATWYEDVNITMWTGNVLTLDRKTRFSYSGNSTDSTLNYVVHGARACLEFYSDVTDPGFTQLSTQCRATNMQLGGGALTCSRYGIAFTCNGGALSPSDANNDEHVMTNVHTGLGPAVIAGVYIGHQNAIGQIFYGGSIGSARSFYGIHAPQGGGYECHGVNISACWSLFAHGGQSAHGSLVVGGLAEGFCAGNILADTFTPNHAFVTADFVQPAINATVNVSVSNSAWVAGGAGLAAVGGGGYYSATIVNSTTVSLKNLGNVENVTAGVTVPAGRNIGTACTFMTISMMAFNNIGGPAIRGFTASASSGTNTLVFAGADAFTLFPGMPVVISNADGTQREKNWIQTLSLNTGGTVCTITLRNNLTNNHNTLSGGVYGYLSNTYIGVDVTGFENNITAGSGSIGGTVSNIPGSEVRMSDINPNNPASVLNLFCLPGFSAIGWTMDNSVMNCFGAGFAASVQTAVTYLNNGRIGFGASMFQGTAPGAGAEPVGTIEGCDLMRPGPAGVTAFAGGIRPPNRLAIATPDTVTVKDFIVNYAIASAAVANLPSLAAVPGIYRLRNLDGSHTVTVTPSGGALINGAASYALVAGATIDLDNDGANWHVA